MTAGIVLLIVGAIFTFALRSDGTWVDTRILGVILMLGGIAFIVRARMGRREVVVQEVTEGEETDAGTGQDATERRVVIERRQD